VNGCGNGSCDKRKKKYNHIGQQENGELKLKLSSNSSQVIINKVTAEFDDIFKNM
jgi:hypothetical protein